MQLYQTLTFFVFCRATLQTISRPYVQLFGSTTPGFPRPPTCSGARRFYASMTVTLSVGSCMPLVCAK
jgi:hypothetical protein